MNMLTNMTFNEIPDKFLDSILDYLKHHLYIVRLKNLYDHITSGGAISIFRCRKDMLDIMAESLGIKKIPFLIISDAEGERAFLIRGNDKNAVLDSRKSALEKKSRACTITSTDGLVKLLRKSKSTKGVISITGLSAVQTYLLEKYAIQDLGVEAIGEDLMQDGTYRFSLQGKTALRKEGKINIGYILLEVEMQTEGPGKEKNSMRAANGISYNNMVAAALSGKEFYPFYIVDGKQYMKLTPEGFECGSGKLVNGQLQLIPNITYHKLIPDYSSQLISRLGHYTDPVCTANISEVAALFKQLSIIDYTEKDRDVIASEKIIAKEICSLVDQKTMNDSLMLSSGQYAAKAAHIINEISAVLDGAITGNVPVGYDQSEIRSLNTRMMIEGLNPDDYLETMNSLRSLEIVPIAEKEILDISSYMIEDRGFTTQKEEERAI